MREFHAFCVMITHSIQSIHEFPSYFTCFDNGTRNALERRWFNVGKWKRTMNGNLENEKTGGDGKAVNVSDETVGTRTRVPGVNRRDTMTELCFRQPILKTDWTETPDSDTQTLFRNAVRWVEQKHRIFFTHILCELWLISNTKREFHGSQAAGARPKRAWRKRFLRGIPVPVLERK
jgi:hypothetical protein